MVLAGFFIYPAFSQHPPQDKNWEVVFQDDFNSFNNIRWNINDYLHSINDPQHYILNNVEINNGKLVFTTQKETYKCTKPNCNCNNGTFNYTSGHVTSNSLYKYGYFEIYAKLPASSGYWPAFWLWNNSPGTQTSNCWYNEIDIFEAYGWKADIVESRVHWGFQCPADIYDSLEKGLHTCDYSTGYHWYGLEWDSKQITWYVDRKIVRQVANNMDGIGIQNPMGIIINVSLSGATTGNIINSTTIFPNYMYVDQCNVYQLKCDKNTVVNEITNYNTFNYAVKKSISLSGVSSLTLGQNVFLRATDYIELKDGFTIPNGAELYLDNNPCEIKTNIRGNEF